MKRNVSLLFELNVYLGQPTTEKSVGTNNLKKKKKKKKKKIFLPRISVSQYLLTNQIMAFVQ
jgi:hypothetical protein